MRMSFKLYNNDYGPSSEFQPSETGEEPRHQVVVIDRRLFAFRQELKLVVEPLKFCLLLVLHQSKFEAVKTELPTFSIMVIPFYQIERTFSIRHVLV